MTSTTSSGSGTIARLATDLDSAWLSAALGRDVVVTGAAAVGTGQMADTVRLSFTGAGGTAESVIAKIASPDEGTRATGLMMRAYEAEVRSYQALAPRIGTRLPACHFAEVDPETGWFTLLLEDLAPAVTGDDVAGCSAGVATAAMVELAQLHAPTWGQADLAELHWLNRRSPDSDAFTSGLVASLVEGFLGRYADVLGPEISGVVERFGPRIGAYFARDTGPRAACHGDYRLDNMLFPVGGGSPVVVDWQTATWAHPAGDVAYFLGMSITPETRREHGDALLRAYHEALVAGGVTDYPLEQLVADIRWYAFGGLVMAVGASMLVHQTPRGDVMFTTATMRHAQQVLDLDAEALLA